MFRIADGREHFYQWDVDRQIIVEDNSITEVHFCNRTDDCSLVVDVIDGLANVPNVILQKSFDIRVFGFDGKATRYDEAFKVKARTKPTDYVYTEVEIKRYEDLDKRIDEIEKNGISEEVITNAVEGYLEKNPVDLTGYATEAYVENAIDNIEFPEPDLSKHALKSEIPTKVSQLQNDSKFITREEVPETDLSAYAKKSEIPDVSKFLTSVPSEYITESELNAKNYLTSVPSHYVTESNLNSRDYVTESELNSKGYATGGYVDAKVAGIVMPDLTPYAKKSDIPDISTKADKEHTHTGYVQKMELQNFELEIYDNIDSEYAKKSEIPDVSDFITSIPAEYVTESELNAKGYLTEHQSLAGYATEKYVDDAIANIDIPEGGGGSDVIYLDFSVLSTMWNKATAEEVEAFTRIVSGEPAAVYIKDGSVYSPADVQAMSDGTLIYFYIHRTYEYGEGTQTTKFVAQLWQGVWEKKKDSTATYNYATKAYVDDAIAAIEIPEGPGDIDLSDYYTKEEVDEAIANIDIPEVESKRVITFRNGYTLTEGELNTLLELWQLCKNGGNVLSQNEIFINANYSWDNHYYANYAVTGFYAFHGDGGTKWVTLTCTCANTIGNPQSNPAFGAAKTSIQLTKTDGTLSIYSKVSLELFKNDDYYTKDEIDNLFSGIATAEGGAY